MIAVWIPKSLLKYLTNIIFDENATTAELFTVVVAFAILWFVIFSIVKSIIRPLVHNKPWLREAMEREYERSGKKLAKDFGIDFTKEEAVEFSMNDWPRMQAIYLQHIVGSLFCVPSLLGIGDPSTASSLAICGILSEVGWECQDMIEMLCIRYLKQDGKKLIPGAVLFIFALHHSLTTVLGIPMILHYRKLKALHWLCFNLQFAAALALMISEYTKLLDVSKDRRQLHQFKVLNAIALVTMLWTRVFHWSYLIFEVCSNFYHDKEWAFLVVGIIVSIAFSLFSFLCCVKPFYKKLVKFHDASVEFEALPADAPDSTRRNSVAKLEKAVLDLMVEDEMKEMTDMIENMFVNRKVSRRKTLQPTKVRRRSIMVLSRSKSVVHVLQEDDKKYL